MLVIADTHVHLYPCYNLSRALTIAATNLNKLAGTEHCIRTVFLTERAGCSAFKQIKNGTLQLDLPNTVIVNSGGEESLSIVQNGSVLLILIAGRQVVSAENIELFALGRDLEIEDRLPAEEVLQRIIGSGAIPAFAYSPGKWIGARGWITDRILKSNRSAGLAIGDSSLRPSVWLSPPLFSAARELNLPIIAGSDPLPFAGEENLIGTYGILYNGHFDLNAPFESWKRILSEEKGAIKIVGRRSNLIEVARRLYLNKKAKQS